MRILWWGKYGNYGPDYPRNRTLLKCLNELGHEVIEFRPRFSQTAIIEARFKELSNIDVLWVPCFRQRDLNSAAKWASKHSIPVIFDPLISSYDKQVFERKKFSAGSNKAIKLLTWETNLFAKADYLVADTDCHKKFFTDTLKCPLRKVHTIPVSAEEQLFFPKQSANLINSETKPEVLFFGTFISLQGATYIAKAIGFYSGKPIKLCFLGDGPDRKKCVEIVKYTENKNIEVTFEQWVPIDKLGDRIRQATICLGVFGTGEKTKRVIPNKAYQSLACNRPLITVYCDAYPQELPSSNCGIYWVNPGQPQEIAEAIKLAIDESESTILDDLAVNTYRTYFSNQKIKDLLQQLLPYVR
ncbi:MAG: glycosyltransferase [Pseudomonadales bacterium]|nr:glycosyltransferase [Pseudomonadales bacterium]